MKRIELNIDKTYSHIAGNDFGHDVYNKYIKSEFDGKEELEIWFPKEIEGVSISFVQGLIKDMLKKVSKEELLKIIMLKSENPFLNERLDENLKF